VLPDLDVDANELELVYRARGMEHEAAAEHAREVLAALQVRTGSTPLPLPPAVEAASAVLEAPTIGTPPTDEHEAVGSGLGAAISSFCFFASGAIVPLIPIFFGATGLTVVVIAATLVGLALVGTGAVAGLLSGTSPLRGALRQLAIGYGAAAVTYALGLLFEAR
jgi:VIT1/CCC1 family predicted Fe2+/Mn2+ transporter